MEKTRATIVVPTIREESIKKFIELWHPIIANCRLIVVEDNPTKTFDIKFGEHYAWDDIETEFGDNSWIIPRRISAIRNYGFFKALDSPTDAIITLDDDCYPVDDTFVSTHLKNLYTESYVGRWISSDKEGRHMRGFPYRNRYSKANIVLSMGSWQLNPDLDAIHRLASVTDFDPYIGVVSRDKYFPLCSMNFAFKPEYTSILYQPLGGENSKGEKYPYNRIDDIWSGIIFKRLCDKFDLYCYLGTPQVIHERASDPFINLEKESHGIITNEKFWSYIDELYLTKDNLNDCYYEIGEYFIRKPLIEGEDYWQKLGKAMQIWNTLVKEKTSHELL